MTFWDWCSTYPWAAMAFLLYTGFVLIVVAAIVAAGMAYNREDDGNE